MEKKKILFFGILATFLMITTSIVSAVYTNDTISTKETTVKKLNNLESPLFKIRTQKATNKEIINNVKQKIYNFITKLSENRIFMIMPKIRSLPDGLGVHYGHTDYETCKTFCLCLQNNNEEYAFTRGGVCTVKTCDDLC